VHISGRADGPRGLVFREKLRISAPGGWLNGLDLLLKSAERY
jgi:hypothetical protein